MWSGYDTSDVDTQRAGDIQNCRMALNQSKYRILTEATPECAVKSEIEWNSPVKHPSQVQCVVFDSRKKELSATQGQIETFQLSESPRKNEYEDIRKAVRKKYGTEAQVFPFKELEGILSSSLKCQLIRRSQWFVVLKEKDTSSLERITAVIPKMVLGNNIHSTLSKTDNADELLMIRFSKQTKLSVLRKVIEKEIHEKNFHIFQGSMKLVHENWSEKVKCEGIYLLLLKEKHTHLKILHYVNHKTEEILHLRCLSSDSVAEMRQKFINKFWDRIPSLKKEDIEVYFSRPSTAGVLHDDSSVNSAMYSKTADTTPIFSDSDSDSEEFFSTIDLVVYIARKASIGIMVKYSRSRQTSNRRGTFTLIDRTESTESLRNEIAKICHWNSDALKLSISGKEIPESSTLSNFSELKEGCTIQAKIKPKLSLTIESSRWNDVVEIHRLKKIKDLKQKITQKTGIPTPLMEIYHADQVLNDDFTLNDCGLESGVILQMNVHDSRMSIQIKTMMNWPRDERSLTAKIESFTIDHPEALLLSQLKLEIARILDRNDKSLQLEYNGTVLSDANTVLEAGISDGDTIYINTKASSFDDSQTTDLKVGVRPNSNCSDDMGRWIYTQQSSEDWSRGSVSSFDARYQSEADELEEDGKKSPKKPLGADSSPVYMFPNCTTMKINDSKSDSEFKNEGESNSAKPLSSSYPLQGEQLYQTERKSMCGNKIPKQSVMETSEKHLQTSRQLSDNMDKILSLPETNVSVTAVVEREIGPIKVREQLQYHRLPQGISDENRNDFITCSTQKGLDENLLTELSKHIIPTWKFLARRLELDENDIVQIDRSSTTECREKCFQMLKTWQMRKGSRATMETLIEALRNNDLCDLADKLEHKQ